MLKRLTILVLSAGLTMSLGGCTSKKAAEETPADVAEVAGEGEAGADGAGDIGKTDDVASELGADGLSPEEQLPEEKPAADGAVAEQPPAAGDEFATPAEELSGQPQADGALPPTEETPGGDQLAAGDTAPPAMEPSAAPEPSAEPPPPTEEPMAAGMAASEPSGAPEEPKVSAPLRKIADAPYTQGKVLVNAVYLARKGDTVESISTKIFGTPDKVKELIKVNPILKGRGAKVGDKIYYNSPQRPTDNTAMKTYYEDMGLAPEVYVVNKAENIRAVAKKLLGDASSWKELWATNLDLESKGELAPNTQLRYWANAPSTEMAQAAPPAEVPPAPAEQALNTPPPAPPMEAASPPPQPPVAPAEQALNTPPPPPPVEAAPPPPPPPVAATAEPPPPPPPPPAEAAPAGEKAGGSPLDALNNPDQTMAMGAGAILLLGAVAIFIMIRKRKRRQLEFHTSTQTQIE